MEIKLQIGRQSRCDIVTYSGTSSSGKKHVLRVFPTGSTKGKLFQKETSSLVIRAPYGMRVIFCSSKADNWEDFPYRCFTMIEGKVIPPIPEEPGSLPGIRVPDLDAMHSPFTKVNKESMLTSYPLVQEFSEGKGWSFGTIGGQKLKKNIQMIIFERVGVGESPPASDTENMARVLLNEVKDTPMFDQLYAKAIETLRQKREKASLEKWAKASS